MYIRMLLLSLAEALHHRDYINSDENSRNFIAPESLSDIADSKRIAINLPLFGGYTAYSPWFA